MLHDLRKVLGLQRPLEGLEQILDRVKDGSVSTEDAAEQIRRLAAQPHIPAWFPRVFGFMGAIFGLFGIGFGIYSASFSFNTMKVPGTVVRMVGTTQQSPVVEYQVAGKTLTYHSSLSSSPPAYVVGDQVTMLYHPDDPRKAQIDSFGERWLFPVVFTLVGVTSVIGSFALPSLLRRFGASPKSNPE